MTWQERLERNVRLVLASNDRRVVPVTRAEAVIVCTMAEALADLTDVKEYLEATPEELVLDPAGRAWDVVWRVLETRDGLEPR